MLEVLLWYLIASLIGWSVFPISYRLLPRLPDRGLAFLRPLGLVFWGFVYWILGSLGVFANGAGEAILALGIVILISWWSGRGLGAEMRTWLSGNKKTVLAIEFLFLVAMLYMAVMRAGAPDATGTEKPMELAFINAILRSPTLPPHDPWLSGYAISYYYFGYLMVAMLAKLSAVSGGMAFNLGVSLWFAMTSVAAYGMLYNLLHATRSKKVFSGQIKPSISGLQEVRKPYFLALLAPLFILILSNLGGLMEILHANGTFWERNQNGELTSSFWQGLRIKEWDQPPAEPFELTIKRGGWWWWRSSRVLQDFRLNGQDVEVIDEFPQFSYILADLHPHVLAVPFVLLVLGVILNTFMLLWQVRIKEMRILDWLKKPGFWAVAVILGSLGFLNVWDFPIYLVVFGMTIALLQYIQDGWDLLGLISRFIKVVAILAAAGFLVYLPFYLGFSSQAGPPYFYLSLAFFTPGANFWIMFATILIPILAWLAWKVVAGKVLTRNGLGTLWRGLAFGAGLVFGLWLLSYLLGLALAVVLNANPEFSVFGQPVGQWFYAQQGSQDGFAILGQSLLLRLSQPGTWLTLLVILSLGWAGLRVVRRQSSNEDKTELPVHTVPEFFVLILVMAGAGLTLFPEFFFLKDDFGARMNTIFKFYYQAWIVWGIAASFGTVILLQNLRRIWRGIFTVIVILVLGVGLIYWFFGVTDRLGLLDDNPQNDFPSYGLDGTAYMMRYYPSDWEAVKFLKQAPDGVVMEAVGPQYSQYARIATLTGLPNVLGWPGHEGQWRGNRVNFYPRMDQVKLVYESSDWDQVKAILDMYQVRYIVLGDLERSSYRVDEEKFIGRAQVIFSNESMKVYEYVP